MQLLEHVFIWEWCRARGVLEEFDNRVSTPRIREDPALTQRSRIVFAPTGVTGCEGALADAIMAALGSWDECLLWVTDWGIWASAEDWPRYYAWRARHGSRFSIEHAPGHQAWAGDAAELRELVLQVLENGWDCTLLLDQGGTIAPRRVEVSHDGWVILSSSQEIAFQVAGLSTEALAVDDARGR